MLSLAESEHNCLMVRESCLRAERMACVLLTMEALDITSLNCCTMNNLSFASAATWTLWEHSDMSRRKDDSPFRLKFFHLMW